VRLRLPGASLDEAAAPRRRSVSGVITDAAARRRAAEGSTTSSPARRPAPIALATRQSDATGTRRHRVEQEGSNMRLRPTQLLFAAAIAAALNVLPACGAPAEQPQANESAAQEHAQEHPEHERRDRDQAQPPPDQQHHHHGGDSVQLWATQTAALGIIALDGAGRIVYRSDADGANPPTSRCTGECTQRWVPLVVPEGQELDLLGVDTERVGTLRRDDGTLQVTLAGWPLYTVAGDQGAHDGTGAHGADGNWFAVTPTGEKATL
jgi:predicted lipoprotein with Yx(FWY)xxD motif